MLVYFLIGDRKGVDSDGRGGREELGGVEGGKTVIMIYCERKFPLSIKGKIIVSNEAKEKR